MGVPSIPAHAASFMVGIKMSGKSTVDMMMIHKDGEMSAEGKIFGNSREPPRVRKVIGIRRQNAICKIATVTRPQGPSA